MPFFAFVVATMEGLEFLSQVSEIGKLPSRRAVAFISTTKGKATWTAIMWREAMHRAKTGTTISYQLNTQQIDNNRYYIKAVAQIVQLLATNELAFRGSDEAIEGSEGIFLSLWEFALKRMSACKLFQQLFLTMPSTPAPKFKMK